VRVYKALSIAGSDPSGGAGIQADLKTFSALGVFGTTAVTAVVDENTVGVTGVHPVPVEFVSGQIHSVLSDVGADAIKIGMLHSSELIRAVKDAISEYPISNIVLDPVMVATSGDKLLQDEAIDTLKSELIPFVRLITPNIPEAEILSGQKIAGQADLPDLAKSLSEQFGGKVSVLLKAGHLEDDELVDVFYNAEEGAFLKLSQKRIQTKNTHGTGCTLSSAVAAFLAKGFGMDEAITQAQAYLHQAIVAGADFPIGKGRGPVHHFWNVPGWGEGAKE
jgi:phosphomethylpyrimidine kinase